jgi:beta-N-acetylhexosaminidase
LLRIFCTQLHIRAKGDTKLLRRHRAPHVRKDEKMKKTLMVTALALSLTLVCACGAQKEAAATPTPAPTPSPVQTEDTRTQAQKLLDGMSTREKVGQLFIIRPDSLDTSLTDEQISDASKYGVTALTEDMKSVLEQYPAGGFAIFGKNITAPAQLTGYVSGLKDASAVAPFMGVDEEGGSVSRIANSKGFNVTKYKSMADIGATGDFENAGNVGKTIGAYLKQYGFNLDFAPVCDVNTNPDNIVIGSRSFGSEPGLVAGMASAEINGLHESGIMSCAKHFPGHGDTKGDTHYEFVYVDKTWDELLDCELIPFTAAMDADTDMVMVAHIAARNVTDDGLPSSMSKEMITDKLRGELGYKGVVITDSMAMGAVTQKYSSAEAAVAAIQAGADIVLMPADYREAFDGVMDAVASGKISGQRLDESVLRILNLKEQYGLLG